MLNNTRVDSWGLEAFIQPPQHSMFKLLIFLEKGYEHSREQRWGPNSAFDFAYLIQNLFVSSALTKATPSTIFL
jgi:hypothetical protein